VVLKLGHFGKHVRKTWNVLKCGAAGGWRLVGQIMREVVRVKKERDILQTIKIRKAN